MILKIKWIKDEEFIRSVSNIKFNIKFNIGIFSIENGDRLLDIGAEQVPYL